MNPSLGKVKYGIIAQQTALEQLRSLEAWLARVTLPVKIEEDWTAELQDAHGRLIGKLIYPDRMGDATAMRDALNALPDLVAELTRLRSALSDVWMHGDATRNIPVDSEAGSYLSAAIDEMTQTAREAIPDIVAAVTMDSASG